MDSASSCGDEAGAGVGAASGAPPPPSGLVQAAAHASHPAVQVKSMGTGSSRAASQSIGSAVYESCRELGGEEGGRRNSAVGRRGFGFGSRVFPPLFPWLEPRSEFELRYSEDR